MITKRSKSWKFKLEDQKLEDIFNKRETIKEILFKYCLDIVKDKIIKKVIKYLL